uniref:Uncharacterized protein n=1 Tax=Romanomermis culicivorax TaxID=13658 RepID=A0A915IZJ0_ROMCU
MHLASMMKLTGSTSKIRRPNKSGPDACDEKRFFWMRAAPKASSHEIHNDLSSSMLPSESLKT